ncbi:MAG: tRNA (guanosine(46)-N7)-methyltransferase TrmB [Cytophagales bacterium]
MARQKKKKFAENELRQNLIQPGKAEFGKLKGKWASDFFKNDKPIVLELGCGRGEYSVGLARLFPNKNFVGVDIKGDRMYKGSKAAEEENLNNVAFLRIMIQEIDEHFAENEISEIWITFPDPRPRNRDIKRRLTSERYFKKYYHLLKDGGLFHLKTDSKLLFDFTLELTEKLPKEKLVFTNDLYNSELKDEHFGIKTRYEEKFMKEGFSINYLRFNIISNKT